ncbi:MAG: NAD-dependent epimerase/dehydratase family protein, partial [Pseudomonadota bacterium]
MTNILITGGGGFIGQKLAASLATQGTLRSQPITGITLVDLAAPPVPEASFPVAALAADISDPAACPALFTSPFDVIYHLAAVVSGAAEADFDLGLRVNLTAVVAIADRPGGPL